MVSVVQDGVARGQELQTLHHVVGPLKSFTEYVFRVRTVAVGPQDDEHSRGVSGSGSTVG